MFLLPRAITSSRANVRHVCLRHGLTAGVSSEGAGARSLEKSDPVMPLLQARRMSSVSESVRMTFLAFSESDVLEDMDALASLWKAHFGSCRQGQFDRIDKGRSREKLAQVDDAAGEKQTHGAFLQKSREDRRRAREAGPVDDGAIVLDADVWTQRREDEFQFNAKNSTVCWQAAFWSLR